MSTESGRSKAIPPSIPTTEEVIDRNKTAMRRILEAFNTGETAVVDEVSDPNLISHTPKLAMPPSAEGLKRQIVWFREHFPDAKFEEEEVIAEGDVVYLRWKMTATHLGKFLGRQPTGKKIVHYGHEVCRLHNGKMLEHRDTFDMYGFLDRLGLLDAEMMEHLKSIGMRPSS